MSEVQGAHTEFALANQYVRHRNSFTL